MRRAAATAAAALDDGGGGCAAYAAKVRMYLCGMNCNGFVYVLSIRLVYFCCCCWVISSFLFLFYFFKLAFGLFILSCTAHSQLSAPLS